jgi:hypothetical protein
MKALVTARALLLVALGLSATGFAEDTADQGVGFAVPRIMANVKLGSPSKAAPEHRAMTWDRWLVLIAGALLTVGFAFLALMGA